MTSESLNKASQVVFILTCLALVTLASVHVWDASSARMSSVGPSGPTAQSSPITPGTKLPPLQGVSHDKAALTVVLVVQSRCPYCAASMPFYQRLAKTRPTSRFQLVAAATIQNTTEYLKQRGLTVDAVAAMTGDEIPTTGTPTLVLIGKGGIVIESWLGQLSAAQEKEVTTRIESALRNSV
jgi:hypothetical protein